MSIPQSGGGPIEDRAQLADTWPPAASRPRTGASAPSTRSSATGSPTSCRCPTPATCSIHAMLAGLRDRFGWQPVEEAGNLIGLQRAAPMSAWSPAASSSSRARTLRTIHETCDEVDAHLREVRAIADDDRRRLHRARRRADMDRRADAGDAEGPLRADDPLHGPRSAATARR